MWHLLGRDVAKIIYEYLLRCDGCNQIISWGSMTHYSVKEFIPNGPAIRFDFCRLVCLMDHPDASETPIGLRLQRRLRLSHEVRNRKSNGY